MSDPQAAQAPAAEAPAAEAPAAEAPQQQPQVNLAQVTVDSENTALNLLVSFVAVAQRRGAFTLEEASKVFECINVFRRPPQGQ